MKALAYTTALLLLISLLLSSETKKTMYNWTTDDYAASWKEVEQLDAKGLPKSALPKVEDILMRARREKNPAQEVRAVAYISRYTADLDPSGAVAAIAKLEGEAERSSFPARNVLYALTASAYWTHYQNNRYEILQRTSFAGAAGQELPEDILTWDIHHYITKVISLHELALAQADELKEIPVNAFQSVLEEADEMGRLQRPTLFDFVAHMAINFYSSGESRATLPADQFIPGPEFFELKAFETRTIKASDSLSFALKSLQLMQQLEKFHSDNKLTTALVANKLARLGFVYANTTESDKASLYETELKALHSKYKDEQVSTLVSHQLALHIQSQAKAADGPDHPDYNRLKEAVEICDQAMEQFPGSLGARRCNQLKYSITLPSLSFELPSVVLPEKPILGKFNFSNLTAVNFKIVATDKMDKLKNRRNQKERLEELLKKSSIESWSVNLPDPGDHQSHAVAFDLPSLPYGSYAIIASAKDDFTVGGNGLAFMEFTVSDISFVYKTDEKDKSAHLYVLNRETGQPMGNVSVELYEVRYDWRRESSTTRRVAGPNFTDKDGYLSLTGPSNKSLRIVFQSGKDYLISDESIYLHSNRGARDYSSTRTYFFTDRAKQSTSRAYR